MRNILKNILSIYLCVIYILASCGFVRHACTDDNGVAYVSLLVNNECNHCFEHQNTEHQGCHCCKNQAQADDEDCCEKTIETISNDQTQSTNDDMSLQTFSTVIAAVCGDTDLTCNSLTKSSETYTPLIYYKTPLIYHTGQLRLWFFIWNLTTLEIQTISGIYFSIKLIKNYKIF